jgi:recombinational DNA repair protein RecT
MNEQEDDRQVPSSDLDYQSSITTPVWGAGRVITKELKDKLSTRANFKEYKKGQIRINPTTGNIEKFNEDVIIEEPFNIWGQLGYLTQDLRLGNIDANELNYVRDELDLAYAFLEAGMHKPFIWVLSEVASVTESSHSKNGWFRDGLNTMRTETKQEVRNLDEKTNIFGVKKTK